MRWLPDNHKTSALAIHTFIHRPHVILCQPPSLSKHLENRSNVKVTKQERHGRWNKSDCAKSSNYEEKNLTNNSLKALKTMEQNSFWSPPLWVRTEIASSSVRGVYNTGQCCKITGFPQCFLLFMRFAMVTWSGSLSEAAGLFLHSPHTAHTVQESMT